ncbi:MAG: GTP cyclohydrolase I [Alphaproteobacteria bacterium]|nr:GTP cyclohydrolase I [Alphaproteobacteria bacterium]
MDNVLSYARRPANPAVAANRDLETPLTVEQRSAMIDAVAVKMTEVLDILRIDHREDPNTRDTPRRVAKMYVEELLAGRFSAPPKITEFATTQNFDELIVTGPIEVRTTCAHHLMPIYGTAIVGIMPSADGRLIGLSKYDRVVQHFARRFQVQEELVNQIGEYLVDVTKPRGLAVRIKAVHMCKTHRGVNATHASQMVSSAYFGELKTNDRLKSEFLQECLGLERSGQP